MNSYLSEHAGTFHRLRLEIVSLGEFEVPREAHSVKPATVAELLETFYPDHAKIELFARKQRDGWAVMGNEIDQI